MPEYEMRLRFKAADVHQAARLAEAWADTCAGEYGTRYAGFGYVNFVLWGPDSTLADGHGTEDSA